MEARELRIGNWVNVLHGNVHIKEFVTGGVRFTDGNGGTFSSLHPIPLTEEWLLKFGFEESFGNTTGTKYFELGGFLLNGLNPVIHTHYLIEYVHQLQNLFQAITGQELTIKQQAPV